MPSNPVWASRWLRLRVAVSLAVLGILAFSAPPAARAQSAPAFALGGTAWVANTGGENVLLRDGASYGANAVAAYPQGTPVTLADGPLTAADGSLWYGVVVGKTAGFMDATYLSPDWTGPSEAAQPAAAPAAASPPSQAAPAAAPTASAPAQAFGPVQAYATTDVNVRSGPSYDDAILTVVPAGTVLTPNGQTSGGFVGVAFEGQNAWVDAAYLGADPNGVLSPPAAAPAASEQAAAPAPAAPGGTAATATDLVNLRAGAGYDQRVLRVLPPGSAVTVTGAESGGFVPVWYNGTDGWIDAQYLAFGTPTTAAPANQGSAPAPQPAAPGSERSGTATVTEDVNLRADPSLSAPVVASLPSGTAFEPTGAPVGGFYPVTYGGLTGWVSGAYLQFFQGGPPPPGGPTLSPPDLRPANPAASPGLIWPVSGGTWYVMQGYHGSSHQNQGSLWQYEYSLDLARRDGPTAGAAVIAPASGTVRWLDPATGGISIDVGNDHAVALFHVTVDPALAAGDPVAQGQRLGVISGPGGPGFEGTPHVHFALWQTDDGGNWDRTAVPFDGAYVIDGQAFPDGGGSSEYQGVEFTP